MSVHAVSASPSHAMLAVSRSLTKSASASIDSPTALSTPACWSSAGRSSDMAAVPRGGVAALVGRFLAVWLLTQTGAARHWRNFGTVSLLGPVSVPTFPASVPHTP
jgi:hypothetical protein